GVLNNYIKYTDDIPEIRQGAKEFIEKLYSINEYELVLFTTRNKILAVKWLIDNQLDKYFKDVTNIKIPSYIHIDDRAICFKGDFNQTFDEISNFRVHWKQKEL
ncbi:hypothetical protein IJ531_03910, partial [bacterium]|nr:hypothetical protein [bacterium]